MSGIFPLLLLASSTSLLWAESDQRTLPPVFAISRNTTATLDVDLFFSLFFVFLNEDVQETSSDYTIFAPAGLTTGEAARWLSEETLTEELLLNHIVVGAHLRPELVATSDEGPWSTLGGKEVDVAIDEQGEFRVNGVRVLAWTNEGPALIVVLEDYLFKERSEEKKQTATEVLERLEQVQTTKESPKKVPEKEEFPQAKPRKASQRNCTKVGNTKGRLSIFRDVTVCTETLTASPGRRLDDILGLLDQVASVAAGLEADLGPTVQQFLTFAKEVGMEEQLSGKKEWTVLVPVDSAWMRWMPIDWGFNPFLDVSFLNQTMRGLFIEGQVDLKDAGSSWMNLGGTRLTVKSKGENDFIGGDLVLGWRQLDGGRLVLLDSVPGVTADVVDKLEQANPHLVSLPPLPPVAPPEDWLPVDQPTPMSSLLSVLDAIPATSAMADFMRATPALSLHFGRGHNLTLLVPTDEAFLSFCAEEEQPCANLAEQPDLRLALLLNHLLLGTNLPNASIFTTLGGTEMTVTITGKETRLTPHSAHKTPLLLSEPASVGGVGQVILVDAVLPFHPAPLHIEDNKEQEEEQQASVTVAASTAEDPKSSPIENNLKFEDQLLTLDMGALLDEVRDDSVNFPANTLQVKLDENFEEMPENLEDAKAEEPATDVEDQSTVTEFFALGPREENLINSFHNPTPFFLLNRRKTEKKPETKNTKLGERIQKEGGDVLMEGGKSLKTRVVYINNQRLELPPVSR